MATTNTAPAPPAAGGQEGPALEGRVDRIEAEQQRQGGLLEQILSRLPGPGGGGQGPAATPDRPAPGPVGVVDVGAIQQQVREEIRAADQRRAAEQAETKWRDDVNKTLEQVKQERRPRDPEQGVRGFVQRCLIGRQ